MWLLVLFDLPVGTEGGGRKSVAKFRNTLLDPGFEMAQFSVYLEFCPGKEQGDALARQGEGRRGRLRIQLHEGSRKSPMTQSSWP